MASRRARTAVCSLMIRLLLKSGQVSAGVAQLIAAVAKREREQPERGLLVHRQVGDLVDGQLDVAERLSRPYQLRDSVPVAGQGRPCLGTAHGGPPFP